MQGNEIDIISTVLNKYIESISDIEIIQPNLHGRDSCPHYLVGFKICPTSELSIFPLKDNRYNNLIEKVKILPISGNTISIHAQINFQTLLRSFENLQKEES